MSTKKQNKTKKNVSDDQCVPVTTFLLFISSSHLASPSIGRVEGFQPPPPPPSHPHPDGYGVRWRAAPWTQGRWDTKRTPMLPCLCIAHLHLSIAIFNHSENENHLANICSVFLFFSAPSPTPHRSWRPPHTHTHTPKHTTPLPFLLFIFKRAYRYKSQIGFK